MTVKVQDSVRARSDSALARARALAANQHDTITFRQAVDDAGMSPSAVSRMSEAGWKRVLPGVYLTDAGGTEQDLMAAVLWAGPDGVLSHRAAAHLHGFDGFDEADAELTLPVDQSKKHPHLAVHRAPIPARDRTTVRGFPVTTPIRTLMDVASCADLPTLSGAFEHAWRTRRVSPALLEKRLQELGGQGRPGAKALNRLLRDAKERRRPFDSILEARLWWMLVDSDLPRPEPQYEVSLGRGAEARLDFAYPKRGLAVETDSMEFHGDKAFFLGHCERLTRLAAAGWRVMHFTKDKLAHPERVLAQIRSGLARRKP